MAMAPGNLTKLQYLAGYLIGAALATQIILGLFGSARTGKETKDIISAIARTEKETKDIISALVRTGKETDEILSALVRTENNLSELQKGMLKMEERMRRMDDRWDAQEEFSYRAEQRVSETLTWTRKQFSDLKRDEEQKGDEAKMQDAQGGEERERERAGGRGQARAREGEVARTITSASALVFMPGAAAPQVSVFVLLY
jgi:hypothetical protein